MLDIVFLCDFEDLLSHFIEGVIINFRPLGVDCEHDFVLEVRLQVDDIEGL